MISPGFFSKCACAGEFHEARCHGVAGKRSHKYELRTKPSGVLDIYSGDGLMRIKKEEPVSATPKILWIQEPRDLSWWDGVYKKLIDNWDTYFHPETGFKLIYTHDLEFIREAKKPEKVRFLLGNGFWIKSPEIYVKSKSISMIDSTKRYTKDQYRRADFADELQKNSDSGVDVFGRFRPRPLDTKEEGLCEYRYSIVGENSCADTWITEKVLDCFATGTIPIYYGTRRIVDHFNADGIIFLEDHMSAFNPKAEWKDWKALDQWMRCKSYFTEELYESKLAAIEDNLQRVKKIECPIDFIIEDATQLLYK